jgi:hypothetical protein
MNRTAGSIAALVALLLVGCGQTSPVDEIIDSNIEARGGQERIQALRSFRAVGTATASGGRVAKVVYEMKRGGFFRLEFSSQGLTSVFAHDENGNWEVDPLEGQFDPRRTSPETTSAMGVGERDIEGHFVDWREKGHTVELLGRESLAGGEAFKLKTTLEDGMVRHDYIDVTSRHIVRSEIPRIIRGREVVLVDTFSDFREADGLVVPYHIEMAVQERPEVITVAVDSVELDPELDDARFQFPE